MEEETLFEFEAERSRHDIAAYLRAFAGELDGDGPVTLHDDEGTIVMTPPERAMFDMTVERECEDERSELEIELEIEWNEDGESSAERVEEPPESDARIQFAPDSEESEPSQGRFEVYRDNAGEWRWRLVHRNGNIIADGGEGYSSKQSAIKGLRSVQHNAPGARVEELDRE